MFLLSSTDTVFIFFLSFSFFILTFLFPLELGGSSLNLDSVRKFLQQASLLGKAVKDSQKYGWRLKEEGNLDSYVLFLFITVKVAANEQFLVILFSVLLFQCSTAGVSWWKLCRNR